MNQKEANNSGSNEKEALLSAAKMVRTREETRKFTKSTKRIPAKDLLSPSKVAKTPAFGREQATAQMLKQNSEISSGRVGDILPTGYTAFLQRREQMDFLCSCGTFSEMSKGKFLDRLSAIGQDVNYAPFNKGEKSRYICRHIHKALKEAYPSLYRVWESMRASVVSLNAAGKGYQAEEKWFDKATGLYQFLSDVGGSPGDDYLLRKVGSPGSYTKGEYKWKRKLANRKFPARRDLNQRYYNTRRIAKEKNLDFRFLSVKDFSDHLMSIFPEGGDISQYRLRWERPGKLGYSKTNVKWVKCAVSRENLSNKHGPGYVGQHNFAGKLVDSPEYQLMSMRLIEILLEEGGSVEGAVEQVLKEFANFTE